MKKSPARNLLQQTIMQFKPDVVCAHSLGSLVSYDTFTAPGGDQLIKDRIFVTFGSQIGNGFVAANFLGGRVTPLPGARHWYHLYNKHDDVFAAPLKLHFTNFTQIETFFDIKGIMDHDAAMYLSHPSAFEFMWSDMGQESKGLTPSSRSVKSLPWTRRADKRALLVGINDYPDPSMKLEGCVNDVFLMSSVLQESGFKPEDIRVVLDKRATTAGIMERLDWLLEETGPNDVRFLYYSGHGAQMAGYGLGDRVDRMDEALVPWDFDWSPDHAIVDDQFYQLYSQFPYDAGFLAVFDCCHSGGMTRGAAARVRGINPPDDIRHRQLRWNREMEMWETSDARDTVFDQTAPESERALKRYGLGKALPLRVQTSDTYDRLRKTRGHQGPYMPVLIYACQESQFSYEYRHGNVPHGAFTFSLVKNLRKQRATKKRLTYQGLVAMTAEDLKRLGYDQSPKVAGPKAVVTGRIPGIF